MSSSSLLYDISESDRLKLGLPALRYKDPPADGLAPRTAPMGSNGTAGASVILRSSIPGDPAFPGLLSKVGDAIMDCFVAVGVAKEQRLLDAYFTDDSGVRVGFIGDKKSVNLVVKSENMSGETLIVELDENIGLPKVNGRPVTPQHCIRVPIIADLFHVKIAVVPTIFIFTDGKISKTHLANASKVQFIYKDATGTLHDLREHDVVHTQKWLKGVKSDPGGGAKKVTVGGKTRWYTKDGSKTSNLVNPFVGGPFIYDVAPVRIHLHKDTTRPYFNPDSLACLFGALAEVGFTDVISNGSVGTDGTGAYSVSHVNGFNNDLKYLRSDGKMAGIDTYQAGDPLPSGKKLGDKYDRILVSDPLLDVTRQNEFNDALYKFGFKQGRSYFYQEEKTIPAKGSVKEHTIKVKKLLNHCVEDADHDNHLHLESFSPSYQP